MANKFGSPVLPAFDNTTYKPMEHANGTLRVTPIAELDTHALQLTRNDGYVHTLAMHPNGHSCKELAKRMLDAWNGTGTAQRALDQFRYILDCGGMGIKESAFSYYLS